ncbi:hypothetical protein J8L85_12560 [Maribacter sp. MMG018]|uniref:GIY-YIG nuclease family protein n=1 Tax=Maribacter sp. MMG018 TaxID=2822688 RepID=UPI001B3759B2|nr:hypothetical protein [Maribacter sp. MMG018]MBQ4915276.1 hypothetical protein [Maribacter sp. MMG018]
MTLHEAIQQILLKYNRAMTTQELADALNKTKLYVKKKGSPIITAYQIHGRTKNYPHLFDKTGSLVSLKNKTGHAKILKPQIKNSQKGKDVLPNVESIKDLMNIKKFKSTADIDSLVPPKPGLYCICIKNIQMLGPDFSTVLKQRKHNIIYIGMASKSLKTRFLGQELRAKGHGTFFRSLGAVLGFTPEKGSLVGKKNQNNYKFSPKHQEEIIDWINKNLIVNWVEVDVNLDATEKGLLKTYLPLLNLTGNPGKLTEVTQLRDECKRIARGSY